MRRAWRNWQEWECFKAGLYDTTAPDGMRPLEARIAYRDFLGDTPRFEAALARVLDEWPTSCEHFLTNEYINRIAWLGQASMCIATGVPSVFRAGFCLLDRNQQANANSVAEKWLRIWLDRFRAGDGEPILLTTPTTDEMPNERGTKRRVRRYLREWEQRGYPEGIPGEVPHRLMVLDLAPSYKAVACAILSNDLYMTSLGFSPPSSAWHEAIVRYETKQQRRMRMQFQRGDVIWCDLGKGKMEACTFLRWGKGGRICAWVTSSAGGTRTVCRDSIADSLKESQAEA